MRLHHCALLIFALATLFSNSRATETEHLGIRVVPAPGKVVVDGKANDWDLSGGLFTCGDVENLRDSFGVWFYAMYDDAGLYFLARWNDETPLNNPGQTSADYGFAGDCLQVRFITASGKPEARGGHLTCWQGRDGKNIIFYERGTTFNEGVEKDATTVGAQQAFTAAAGGKHYTQEIFIPWKLLTRDEKPLHAGDGLQLTLEPNFTLGARGRLSLKDIFKPGITPDRVFTFMAPQHWGLAKLEPQGKLIQRPVRLADAREFPVTMKDGEPAIDWTGLVKSRELLGFETIKFELPRDGYVSLNIKDAQGMVVRQLTSAVFFAKGSHEVRWDGLTTPSGSRPGTPVPSGDYTWSGIYHGGVGLRLQGWACNAGNAPWDGPSGKNNWGGDHGIPSACAADKKQVYLAWNGAEAGKAVLAVDNAGNVLWTNIRGGIAGASGLASDGAVLYVLGGLSGPPSDGAALYKLDAKTGSYLSWNKDDLVDLEMKSVLPAEKQPKKDAPPLKADGIEARGGKIYLSFAAINTIAVLDAQTGQLLKMLNVRGPRHLKAAADALLYVVSDQQAVLAVNPLSGEVKELTAGLKNATGIAVDSAGSLYIGTREPENQVLVYSSAGKLERKIGRAGGRALTGAWTSDGLAFAAGLAVDAEDNLWVAEADAAPKRISVWNGASGKLVRELFGPSAYGALGGNINPLEPPLMVGQGCEWLLDAKTGRATCLGVVTRDGMENARFAVGSNGKLYLATAGNWAFNTGPLKIYERTLGGKPVWGEYKLRSVIFQRDDKGQEIGVAGLAAGSVIKQTCVWSDDNGDGERQPAEVTVADGDYRFSGWYMNMTPDLTLYAGDKQFKATGFTACGAPKYDLAQPTIMPAPGLGSADGKLVLQSGEYNVDHGMFRCFDIGSKKLLWSYPDNFVGVHGSHNATPPEPGMIRGSFTPCGAVKLPDPIGNVWAIPTNVGEWHLLTGEGYYLTRLFQPDPLKVRWPEEAVPGASLDNAPCGMGGEDFGGSITLAANGKLYVQAGKTGFWNVEVTGLDGVKKLPGGGGGVNISAAEVAEAGKLRDQYLQAAVGTRKLDVKRFTPSFTGNLDSDFPGADLVSFKKQDDAAVRATMARDDKQLYVAWDVVDATPWINGADAPEFLYARGDTVDLQLGTNPQADRQRSEAAAGDLRLSIGNFQGTPTAVLYRKISAAKHPKQFSSGVIKQYQLDSVTVVADAKINFQKRDKGYVVEAAIPLTALELTLAAGTKLAGDLGVTHGDLAGSDTVLRSYWNNQKTGIVNDEVFELMIEPKNWGEFDFEGK